MSKGKAIKVEVLKHVVVLVAVLLAMNYILVDMPIRMKTVIFIFLSSTYIGNYWAYLHNEEKLYRITKKISFYLVNFLLLITLINIISTIAIFYDREALQNLLEQNLYLGKWIYFILSFFTPYIVIISEPLTVVTGNTVFNPFWGFTLGYLGNILGIFSLFMIFRKKGSKYIKRLIKEKDLEKYRKFVSRNEGVYLMVLFIFPILPDGVICGGAGLSDIKWKKFLAVAGISKVFTVLTYTFLVDRLKKVKLSMEIFSLLGVVIVIAILIKIYIKRKKH